MDFCKTVELLYAFVPLRPFRDWLIRAHMERCPRCQAGLLSREEARSLLVGPDQVGGAETLWRRISDQAGQAAPGPGARPGRPRWALSWAGAAALAAVVALTGFWLLREIERPGPAASAAAPAERFRIEYVNVGGAPAQTFVYQPQGSDVVFVWAQKSTP